MYAVHIGDYDLYKDFGLKVLSVEVGTAEADTKFKEIPGRNGSIDLTETLTGFVTYKNATMKLIFDFADGNHDTWIRRGSDLFNALHGKRTKIVLGNNGTFFYEGRISVLTEKLNKYYSKLEIEANRDPYKYEMYSSVEDWLWDDFNFEDGIIREYKHLSVDGTLELHIPGRSMPVIPEFDCSAAMKVTYNNIIYNLPTGKSRSPDMLLTEGDNVLMFSGTGTVTIEYRGGSL